MIERYGEAVCGPHVATIGDPTITYVVSAVSAPMPWDWTTDGLTRTIDGAYFVDATVSDDVTAPLAVTLHIVPVNGLQRYFIDCGDPLPGAP